MMKCGYGQCPSPAVEGGAMRDGRREGAPPNAATRKLFVQRGGRRRFVGEVDDAGESVLIYVHSDGGGLYPLPKREIIGAALWNTREAIAAAADVAGCTFDQMAAFVAAQLPELLREFPFFSGSVCPDLKESTDVGSRSSGPRAA
jgi:hypothetical protein